MTDSRSGQNRRWRRAGDARKRVSWVSSHARSKNAHEPGSNEFERFAYNARIARNDVASIEPARVRPRLLL